MIDSTDFYYLVVTIPGTRFRFKQFYRKLLGKKAVESWSSPDSSFCRSLIETLKVSLKVVEFPWNGWNSQKCRVDAAQKLRSFLLELKTTYSEARFFCIAHSHGGGVLWMAMSESHCEGLIDGAICLGTPFLSFGKSGLFAQRSSLREAIAFTVLVAGLALHHIYFREIRFWVFLLGLVVLGLAIAFAGEFKIRQWRTKAERYANNLKGCLNSDKFLLIRATGDEVNGLLSGIYFLGWIPIRLCNWIDRKSRNFDKSDRSHSASIRQTVKHLLYACLFVMFVQIGITIVGVREPYLKAIFYLNTFLSFGIVHQTVRTFWRTTLAFLSGVLIALAFLIRSLLVCFFIGPDLARYALFMNIAVEPSPPGNWHLLQLDPFPRNQESDDEPREIMSHNVHAHPEVTEKVCDWILTRELLRNTKVNEPSFRVSSTKQKPRGCLIARCRLSDLRHTF